MDVTDNILSDIDRTKAVFLEQILKDSTSSYKYYWLKSIIVEVCAGNLVIPFSRLVSRMVSLAWYPIVSFHLSLGATDKLGEMISCIKESCLISRNPTIDEIVNVTDDAIVSNLVISKKAKQLTNYVPYRAIRPFYEKEVRHGQDCLKRKGIKRYDAYADKLIKEAMRLDPERGLYSIQRFSENGEVIVLSESWAAFIINNQPIVEGWLDYKLTCYLQARNPSVPAISLKLHPPIRRDLRIASNFWKDVLALTSFVDIYSRQSLTFQDLDSKGSLGIDHFIPWSFVMHNESWNLTPTFGAINSSKSDKLPSLELYLVPFCELQFDAIMTVRKHGHFYSHRHYLDSYRQIDPCFDEYVDNDASRKSFSLAISKTITPLFQIAWNQGYLRWEYDAGGIN